MLNNELSINGPAGSGEFGALVYLNDINFNSDVIDLEESAFSVQVDITRYSTVGSGRYMGIGIGQSLAELESQVGVAPTSSVADLYIGFRETTGALEIYNNGVYNEAESVTTNLPSASVTMRIDFYASSFSAGEEVSYNLHFNNSATAFTSGTFTWSGTDENYICLSSNLTNSSTFDNFEVDVFDNSLLTNEVYLLNDDQFNLYPNPFDDSFNLKFYQENKGIKDLKIIDLSGNVVYNHNFEDSSLVIENLTFDSGIYILVLEIAGEKFYKKILKK